MEYKEPSMNVSYVITGDLEEIIDPIWREFVDHILSVGSTDDVHFVMKHMTSRGSDAFKELRDEEIGRELKHAATLYNIKMGERKRESLKELDETNTDINSNSRRNSRRATVDSQSRRSTLVLNRRGTKDLSHCDVRQGRRGTSTSVSWTEHCSVRNSSPNTRKNSQDSSSDNPSLKPDSRRNSENIRQRNTQDLKDSKSNFCSRKTSPCKRQTPNTEKVKISTVRDILKEMEMENANDVNSDECVIEAWQDGENVQEHSNRTSASSFGWRAVRREIQDKQLEKIKEDDICGWKLVANTAHYVTDTERARQRLYAKYITGNESPWHDGLKTYDQYKHVLDEGVSREQQLKRLKAYRKSRGVANCNQARPASVSTSTGRRPKTIAADAENAETTVHGYGTRHRPSTCPPFRPNRNKASDAQ